MQKCRFLIRSAADKEGCEALRGSVTEKEKWIFNMICGRCGKGGTWVSSVDRDAKR